MKLYLVFIVGVCAHGGIYILLYDLLLMIKNAANGTTKTIDWCPGDERASFFKGTGAILVGSTQINNDGSYSFSIDIQASQDQQNMCWKPGNYLYLFTTICGGLVCL